MLEMTLPFPPSINGYWRTFRGRQIISKRGREYRRLVLSQIAHNPNKRLKNNLEVTMVLFPPDRRKRDIDNYTKAVFDAITHAGVWEDDSQVKLLILKMDEAAGKPGRVELFICGMS